MSNVFSMSCTKQQRMWDPINKDWDFIPLADAFLGYNHSEDECKELISSVHPYIITNFPDAMAEGDGIYGHWRAFSIPDNEEPNVFWLYMITQID